jgi:hypothetical protein
MQLLLSAGQEKVKDTPWYKVASSSRESMVEEGWIVVGKHRDWSDDDEIEICEMWREEKNAR